PPNDTYTRAMLQALRLLKDTGIDVIVFGDIFLEDLRAFRDRLLAEVGLAGCYPLWGRDSAELFREFIGLGFMAVTVCVDTIRFSVAHCGQPLTPAFADSLPGGVDPCGERGEYHSFAFDGPLFRRPVLFRTGDIHRQEPFVFRELYPGAGMTDKCKFDARPVAHDDKYNARWHPRPLECTAGSAKGEDAVAR